MTEFGYIYLNDSGDLYEGSEKFRTRAEIDEFVENDEYVRDFKLYIIEGKELHFYDRT